MKKISMKVVIVFLGIFLVSGIASASLLDGKNLRIRYLFPDLSTDFASPMNVIVGPGVEADFGFGTPEIDVSDMNIYFDFSAGGAPASFNGFQFIDFTSTIDPFSVVTIASTNLAFDSSRITYDDDNIWVNFESISSGPDGFVSLNINSAPIPEPTTMLLLGGGLVGLAGFRRKFRKI